MERLTDKKEADAQRLEYENRLKNGYPRNIPEERFLKLAAYEDAMPLERAKELAKAERDGRMIVPPCKVGDTVYEANKRGFVSTYEVISIHVSSGSVLVGWNLIDGIYSNINGFEVSALGKTVFLTHEEAEEALKKRKEADNETD